MAEKKTKTTTSVIKKTNQQKDKIKTPQQLSAKEIVEKLNEYIIGQHDAKKATSIALRNRYRLSQIEDEELKKAITPKNVMLIGPTGVGKTEIARCIARIYNSPFIKIEATKFTEIGYVGKDVESIIRELVEVSIQMQKKIALKTKQYHKKITQEEIDAILLEAILMAVEEKNNNKSLNEESMEEAYSTDSEELQKEYREKLKKGELENFTISLEIEEIQKEKSNFLTSTSQQIQEHQSHSQNSSIAIGVIPFEGLFKFLSGNEKRKVKKLTVKEAREFLIQNEEESVDEDKIIADALKNVEENGIVFIDEIDKLISSQSASSRGEVSREGVQRDLLSIIEGTVISTKYGMMKTDSILFLSSGAFHSSKPSELMPEFQGRFPIKVHLNALTEQDFIDILTKVKHNFPNQYKALLAVDKCTVDFTEGGIKKIANIAKELNLCFENTGARRLIFVLESVMNEVSFEADGKKATKVKIDEKFVEEKTKKLFEKMDIKKENYII